jgi:hypothetical protein
MANDSEDDDPRRPENRGETGEAARLPAGVRDAAGRFVTGSTGNSGGRPGTPKEFRELARSYAPTALKKLYTIALSGDGMSAVRACEIIIERAFGRMPAAAAGPKGGPVDGRFYSAARSKIEELVAKAAAERQAAAGESAEPKN